MVRCERGMRRLDRGLRYCRITSHAGPYRLYDGIYIRGRSHRFSLSTAALEAEMLVARRQPVLGLCLAAARDWFGGGVW